MEKEIGTAILEYNEDGSFLQGRFRPKEVVIDMPNLMDIKCNTNENKLKANATTVFASWVESVNQLQLIDLTKQTFKTEFVGDCVRWKNGNIAKVKLLFKIVDL